MRIARICPLLLGVALGTSAHAAGDRGPPLEIVYPPDAFLHNGGRVIDVTKPPCGAKGDGKSDDTKALVAACDFVADKLRGVPWTRNPASYIIYLPRGTYLVSDTIFHSGPIIKCMADGWDGMFRLRFVGQSREETVIRLRDSCPGFQSGSRPVLAFQRGPGTNVPGINQCRNLTVDVGRGNPGATGVLFMGANTCAMSNVTIRSSDGRGAVGLDLAVFSVQGHMRDITVEGFDYGVRAAPMAECNPALEHLTLRGQNKAGVLVEQGSPCIRDLRSVNVVPAVSVTKRAAHVVIVDSVLERGAAAVAGIDLRDGTSQLFVRNVRVSGYGAAVKRGDRLLPPGHVKEYLSGPVQTLHEGQREVSLNLPVEEAPLLPWERDLSRWANPDRFPGATDAERVQRAMDSGATTVYFPRESYAINRQVRVPPTVRHIDFMYCTVNNEASFVVDRPSPVPLWIENKGGYSRFRIRAQRTVVMRHCGGGYEIEHAEPMKAFLESCVNISCGEGLARRGQRVWARSINNEYKHTSNFKVAGGTLWVLGFKTEGAQPSFEVTQGGVCEVLGGYRNETEPDKGLPMVINRDSHVSFVGYTSMATVYEQAIEETWKGTTARLSRAELPPRLGYDRDFYVTLYAGYGIEPRPVEPPEPRPEEKPRAKPRATPPKAPAVPADVLALWDGRLREHTRAAAGAKRRVDFMLTSMRQRVRLLSADGERLRLELLAMRQPVTVRWSALALQCRKSLAAALAKSGSPGDVALAAFYTMATGDRDAADDLLEALPDDKAREVREAFD